MGGGIILKLATSASSGSGSRSSPRGSPTYFFPFVCLIYQLVCLDLCTFLSTIYLHRVIPAMRKRGEMKSFASDQPVRLKPSSSSSLLFF